MKITTRAKDDTVTVGSGGNRLLLSDDELRLVAAMVSTCRLGRTGYSQDAFNILSMLEDEFGVGFINDAIDAVPIHATIEDDTDGSVVLTTVGNPYSVTIELP